MLTPILFLISLVFLWIGSGIAVRAVTTISHNLKISSFVISFFVLGFFTSLTEIIVGITALLENQPEIYVGNLIGSSAVVCLLIIPLLAMAGNGVNLNNAFKFKDIIKILFIVATPALLTFDNNFSPFDASICFIAYIFVAFMINKKTNIYHKLNIGKVFNKTIYTNILRIFFAILIVLAGSHILVNQIPSIGQVLNISPFIVSMLVVSFGTSVPELTIALRSIANKNKDIALGDYLGSTAFNTLEIGLLTLFNKNTVTANGSNFSIIAFAIGLFVLAFFIKSKNCISRNEGTILILFYVTFMLFELFTGPGWDIK